MRPLAPKNHSKHVNIVAISFGEVSIVNISDLKVVTLLSSSNQPYFIIITTQNYSFVRIVCVLFKFTLFYVCFSQSRSSLYAEYAPKTPNIPRNTRGPPCSQRCFNFSFVFNFGQWFWKHEWSFKLMWCAVTLSTYKSAKSCNVNVVQSLALT